MGSAWGGSTRYGARITRPRIGRPGKSSRVLPGRRTYDFEENAAVQRTGARELRPEAALGGNGIPTRQLLPEKWTLTQPCNL